MVFKCPKLTKLFVFNNELQINLGFLKNLSKNKIKKRLN